MKEVKCIIDASFHRNGIGGAGFYAVLFEGKEGLMVATLFDDPGYCAVYSVEQLAQRNIAFGGGNSWRGDVFEAELRPLLRQRIRDLGSNRIGPFALPIGKTKPDKREDTP